MTHIFKVTGLTCNGCVKKVQNVLSEINGVESVIVTLEPPEAEIKMHHHINGNTFNSTLEKYGDYKLGEELSSGHKLYHDESS